MSRKMRGANNNYSIPVLQSNNLNAVTNKEKANLLAESFSAISSNNNYSPTFQQFKQDFELKNKEEFTDNSTDAQKDNHLNMQFTLAQLKLAIQSCNKNKSAGPDNIPYEFLKELPELSLTELLKFYNYLYNAGKLPQRWKHAIILPLYKPDKTKSDPLSYRPISLTSCLCKVMEKLVNQRLTHFLESNRLLNNCQTGFRKNKSTLDQIIKLQDKISKYNNNRGFTVAVFLDFEKAYDMLWRKGLMTKLKNLGINGNMFSFINDFIENRTFQVKVGAEMSDTKLLENGTPQGSIISPILFLVMINDIDVGNTGVDLSLFADDSATYKSGKNINQLLKDIQTSLNSISKWADKWGIKISNSKSVGIIFTHRVKYNILNPLTLNGNPLKMETKAKFLGMIYDKKLTWRDHVQYIEDRCKARLNLMRSLTGTGWGASKESLLTIYRALIRSLLDYGAEALDSASESVKSRFDVIQSKALRICCGAMNGTAVAALQSECGEPPLSIRRLKQQLKYSIKVKSMADHPSKNVLEDHWTNYYGKNKQNNNVSIYNKVSEIINDMQVEQIRVDKHPPWLLRSFDIDKSLSKSIKRRLTHQL